MEGLGPISPQGALSMGSPSSTAISIRVGVAGPTPGPADNRPLTPGAFRSPGGPAAKQVIDNVRMEVAMTRRMERPQSFPHRNQWLRHGHRRTSLHRPCALHGTRICLGHFRHWWLEFFCT